MKKLRRSLLGIDTELDIAVQDMALFGYRYQEVHTGSTGDVSQVLSRAVSAKLVRMLLSEASPWFEMSAIEELKSVRADGRTGYRSEGIKESEFYRAVSSLAGRVLLITCTGSQIPAIHDHLRRGEDGRLLNLVEVRDRGRAIRVLYGNREFGTIPSIELHVHMLAAAMAMADGVESPAVVHAHPYHLTMLGMHPRVRGDFKTFNAAAYTQIEGLNRNVPGLIGVVPYKPSGSAALVSATREALRRHALVLWMNHGFIVRSYRIERAYSLLAYAEQGARAALEVLRFGGRGLPSEHVLPFLRSHGLLAAHRRLRLGRQAGNAGHSAKG